MKYLSLFTGIGGFELAIENVFPDAECLGFSEIDPIISRFYMNKHPSHRELGDVFHADFTQFDKNVDLVVAGFPCCDLSLINPKRKLLKGKKSSLVSEVVRCIKECKPRFFLVENVTKTSPETVRALNKMFGVTAVALNSHSVSAQRRNRLFWFNWELRNNQLSEADPSITFVSILEPKENVVDYEVSKKMEIYYATKDNSFRAIRHNSTKMKSGTLCGTPTNVLIDERFQPSKKRRLTGIEMERLQTFPDNYTSELAYAKRLFGLKNAVTVSLVTQILMDLKRCMLLEEPKLIKST
jgi:site-specific DNA-cytosine methylase